MIKSASPEKPVLIRIHIENSSMKLRIRLLEIPRKANNLLKKIYISGYYNCGHRDLSLSENRTLIRQTSDDHVNYIIKVFIHQSRVFYISEKDAESSTSEFYYVLTDNGKFFTSLPQYFRERFDMHGVNFLSYDKKLLFVPSRVRGLSSLVLFISEDFFRGYEIIPVSGYLSKYTSNYAPSKYNYNYDSLTNEILIFQEDVVAITNLGAQFRVTTIK